MAKQKEKEVAQHMRRLGTSIAEIAQHLHVSKSTASCWCREISLSPSAMERIISRSQKSTTRGILAYTGNLRLQRQKRAVEDTLLGSRRVGQLSKRDLFFIGLGLYWGEGYKRGNQEFGFTNSDPEMIKTYLLWLKSTFNVASKDLILRVSVNNNHSHRVNDIENFWSKITSIPRSQFTKISLIQSKNKKEYSNELAHFGTLRIKVRRGTRMRREILGAIASISNKLTLTDQ